ncbi:hypothetical protein AQI88_38190 [Streptomyces cellostaticus]|uniref:Uncharacterized protein n=1 Tax=Streptomyces cellostaticus TaxID=67285 RepID=A0A101NDJ9_9ACTN|nr:hypothetical protein AQI88_38190 [Streptomyces cellostaticus]
MKGRTGAGAPAETRGKTAIAGMATREVSGIDNLNRSLLALARLVLLGGGLLILIAGLDICRRHDLVPKGSTGTPGMPTEVRLQVAGHKPHRAE